MIRKAYNVFVVLNTVANLVSDILSYVLTDQYWLQAKIDQDFLETAAKITREQSESFYVLISVSSLAF